MYKLIIICFFTFFIQNKKDLVTINHNNYITTFSKSKNYPVKVEWWITSSKLTCKTPLKRENSFKADPNIDLDTKFNDDYLNSGYDRGHMCPAADNLCLSKSILGESFYFTNISPQQHSLNSGDWLTLENYSRDLAMKYDSIHVWSGNVGEIKRIKDVSVPEYCWKVIYINKTKSWDAFIFKNNKSKPDGIEDNRVKLSEIEKLTGLKF
jgi:endonuclease G